MDAAWSQKTPITSKITAKLGGMKQEFVRPAAKRKRDHE